MKLLKRLIESFGSYLKWFYLFIKNCFRVRYKKYDNRGKKFVAIGNGPSAGRFPFSKYKNDGYCFVCVNFFALDEKRFFDLKPQYYCCIDSVFSSQTGPLSEKQKELISILERVDWKMVFICLPSTRLPIKNKLIEFHYINTYELKGKLSYIKKKLYDSNKANHGYQNVIVAVLYYLVMSKASEIILTGVENDWHRELYVDAENIVYRETTHFYGNERINITGTGGIRKGELYRYFYYYYMTLYNYHLNSVYAQKSGVKILNACPESYIDVYEKINAEETECE